MGQRFDADVLRPCAAAGGAAYEIVELQCVGSCDTGMRVGSYSWKA